MLGKASEIKLLYLEGLQHCGISDCGLPGNAIIIGVKFSTSYEQNYGVHNSALIIYKEESA